MMNLNPATLRRAADLSEEIAAKQQELNQLMNGQASVDFSPATVLVSRTGNRRFSPEAIEKIRAAQRRRWKNVRKQAAAAQASVAALMPPAPAVAPAPAPEEAQAAPAPEEAQEAQEAQAAPETEAPEVTPAPVKVRAKRRLVAA